MKIKISIANNSEQDQALKRLFFTFSLSITLNFKVDKPAHYRSLY